jgi:type VI secretion system ImpM family protein
VTTDSIDPHALAEAPGWFGKMPALGDFASRRLPPDWVDGWDGWLQRELVRARDAIGEDDWLSLYLVAPVRRFWLAPGLLAGAAWLGVMMPSVDSVGRHFPFTLTTPLPAGHDDLIDALANSDWLDAADAVAREVLDPACDVGQLEQALLALPGLHGERRVEVHAGTLLAGQLRDACATLRSAWWCEGAACANDFLLATTLPADGTFDALWRATPQAA